MRRRVTARTKNNAFIGNIGHSDNEVDMKRMEKFLGIKVENNKPKVDRVVFLRRARYHCSCYGSPSQPGCATGHPSFCDVLRDHEPGARPARPLQELEGEQGLREPGLPLGQDQEVKVARCVYTYIRCFGGPASASHVNYIILVSVCSHVASRRPGLAATCDDSRGDGE